MNGDLSVRHLVLKVTSHCNARCYHCRDRRQSYQSDKKGPSDLGLERATIAVEYAAARGLERVTLSGGEPTICNELRDLISLARRHVDSVSLVTNGWVHNEDYWRNQADAGLTHVDVSIDGHDSALHDWLRNKRHLHKRAISTLNTLRNIRKISPTFDFSVVTIVNTFNIAFLDVLLSTVLKAGAARWVLHYPECDKEAVFSPSIVKQQRFRARTLPRILAEIRKSVPSTLVKDASAEISRLFDSSDRLPQQMAQGEYRNVSSRPFACPIPGQFLLVKYNGILLGCNGGEYSDEGIIGRVDLQGLRIGEDTPDPGLLSNRWMAYCNYCPVPDTLRIRLR